MFGLGGNDTLAGGNGVDAVDYSYRGNQPVVASLDGLANDGAAGDLDTITSTVGILVGTDGADALTGNNAGNTLDGRGGNDTLNPLGAGDTVFGGAGNDDIETRDGAVDAVDCGADTDTNNADSGDSAPGASSPRRSS